MSAPRQRVVSLFRRYSNGKDSRHHLLFFVGFAIVALVLAGVVSYFASSSPDGLDATIQRGCDVGACIADNAKEHDGPLAGYTVGGDSRLTGVAGVIGVLATLAVGFGVFSLLRKRSRG